MSRQVALFAVALAISGCSTTEKKEPNDDFRAFVGQALDSPTVTAQIEVLGNLSYGNVSPHVNYSNPPRYRAFTFIGSASDTVDIWARSGNGDPIVWLLDGNFNLLGKNDDASAGTNDAHLTRTLSNDGLYLIVFRDYELWSIDLSIELERLPKATDGGIVPDLGYCGNLQTDPANCGACGHACAQGQLCYGGECFTIRDMGFDPCSAEAKVACGTMCVDIGSDSKNCGICGHVCAQGQICHGGGCQEAGDMGSADGLASGLVAYWKLDGNGVDSSAVGTHTLDWGGSPHGFYDTGFIGQAMSEPDASNWTLVTPPAADIDMNRDFTIAFWAYRESSVFSSESAFENGAIHILRYGNAISTWLIQDPDHAPLVQVVDNSGIATPAIHTWFHVIVYRSGNTVGIKVDNSGTATADVTGKVFGTGFPNRVGHQTYGYPWLGKLDEFGIWNRALSASEMAKLYNGGAGMTLP